MSIGSMGDGQPSPEEMRELQEEMEREREDRNTAQQLASQFATDQGPAEPGYWDVIGSADVARNADDELDDLAATELSRMNALGNISTEDWESFGWRTELEAWTMKNEFKDDDSKMGDDDMRIMYGEERSELTDERARRLRSMSQVKKLMTSLSIEARGLRSGTEIHAVAKTENQEEEQDDGGRVSGFKNWLSG